MSASAWKKSTVHETWETPYMRGEVADFFTPTRQVEPVRWTVVYRPAAIAVAPVTAGGELLMIHQERIGSQQTAWEFPAGQIDEAHFRALDPASAEAEEIRRETVVRELQEEAGYCLAPDGGELVPLGRFFPSPGFTDEVVYLYLARPCVPHENGTNHDHGEAIVDVRGFAFAEFEARVADGSQQDALSLALYARLASRRDLRLG
ncbi:hypothetical protein BH23VER1_BH23VER1_03890 [soil metagenome]